MPQLTMTYDGVSRATDAEIDLAGLAMPEPGAFSAMIARPQIFRVAMLALGDIVHSNFEVLDEEEWRARVLDPVVGIHPDGVSFEAFSQDGSALGWVHFANTVFEEPDVRRGGCTSIDYSDKLEKCFRAIAPASRMRLRIGSAEGVRLEQGKKTHHEKKIDLPDGWLRGFGELHAGLLQAAVTIPLSKADLFNILRAVKGRAPGMRGRGVVFDIQPGERVVVHVEPWDTIIRLQSPPPDVDEPISCKIYGRRRLSLLENLIPHVDSARLHLCGSSRPSYWELMMPGARMILAMSSWTARKFTKSFTESLRGAAAPIDDATLQRAAAFLADAELVSLDELAEGLGMSADQARGVALALCRQGLAIAEPESRGLRWRPLRYLPFAEICAAGEQSSREENAAGLIEAGKLEVLSSTEREGLRMASARCEGSAGIYDLKLTLNPDGSFAAAECACKWMTKNRNDLRGGPCKHLLALRSHVLNRATEENRHA